jgi:MYXO-CTERM domain-containing protein
MYQQARRRLFKGIPIPVQGVLVKRCIATLFLALVAVPATASALPPESVHRHWAAPPLVQRDDAGLPSYLPARGTDVAAWDQQASKPAPGPVPVTSSSDSGLDWADAGVIGGAALAAFAIAGAVGLRRRRTTPLAG